LTAAIRSWPYAAGSGTTLADVLRGCCHAAACGGAASTGHSAEPTTSPRASGVDTATVCRTFESYSTTFNKHFERDAQARNGVAFVEDLTTLQASIGVALFDVRDPKIARKLKIAKRAAAVLLAAVNKATSERMLEVDLLLLRGSQSAIKSACKKATQHLAA
jgi:ethanolamine utilization microcompartment shell protein EutL